MPARELLYYVSGHGYGHATRSAAIMRAFVALAPDWQVRVRTSAPPHLFDGIERVTVHRQHRSLDPGVVEDPDALGVDVAATLRQLVEYHAARETTMAAELDWLRQYPIEFVVADFPPLAGQVAAEAGLPCIGIGNFTWDWIYEPMFGDDPSTQELQHWFRAGYAQMETMLRLPFSHQSGLEMFGEICEMPLSARRATRDPQEVVEHLGIDPADERRRVVLAMRGRIPPAARELAAHENFDCLFLHFETDEAPQRENMMPVRLTPALNFTDVLQIADAVVSKLGYGILSECIAAEKPILCPPRRFFREDEIFDRDAARYVRLNRISHRDFAAGRWRKPLQELFALPAPSERLPLDGAERCAEFIAARVAQR